MTICLDLYCPGQAILLRQESLKIGLNTLESMVQHLVRQTELSNQIGYIDKLPQYYRNKVAYLELPYFFNEWHGFFYYSNESERVFVMEKNFAGCLGIKVINRRGVSDQ